FRRDARAREEGAVRASGEDRAISAGRSIAVRVRRRDPHRWTLWRRDEDWRRACDVHDIQQQVEPMKRLKNRAQREDRPPTILCLPIGGMPPIGEIHGSASTHSLEQTRQVRCTCLIVVGTASVPAAIVASSSSTFSGRSKSTMIVGLFVSLTSASALKSGFAASRCSLCTTTLTTGL